MPLPKIFGFFNGYHDALCMGIAISENGFVLAVNCAETIDSLPSALGLDFVKPHDS
jgi:hypothetical protein